MYEQMGSFIQNEQKMRRAAAITGRLPRRLVFAACAGIGLLIYGLAGKKLRQTVRNNMRDLLAELPEKTAGRYVRRYFVNLAVTMYELLFDSSRLPGNSRQIFSMQGEEHLAKALERGKGAILYLPHVGNFFYYYWVLSQKYPCLTVATASSPELQPLYLNFERLGCKGMDYDETPPLELVRRLKEHLASNGVVFLLGDFYRPQFPQSKLFGHTTRIPAGTAAMAIEREAPVIPFYGKRVKGFKHVLVFGEPMYLHETFSRRERDEASRILNETLEKGIRQTPDQWFYWFNAHERWEDEQPGETKAYGVNAGQQAVM